MNEKSEKKSEPENKVAAKSEGSTKATLGDISGLVPAQHLEDEKSRHTITLNHLKKAEAEVVGLKALVADRDTLIQAKEKSLRETEDIRDLAVKETCEAKSKLVVANRLIESLKAEIDKHVSTLKQQREKTKSARALAVEYRRESAKLYARLTSEGISLEPLSEEPVLDELV
jgi:predicted ribosome quality control (RQC) complex YloA/Tae2 family protein